MIYTLDKPQPINAQKFDLSAYMRDGYYINYKEAWEKNLTRYSKTFMKEKFFPKPEEGKKRRRRIRKFKK